METLSVTTRSRTEFVNVTSEVDAAVARSGVKSGACLVSVPHTTAGVTVNENADPDVTRDILKEMNKVIPFEDGYAHDEGNSAAHIKSSLFGSSLTLPVEEGRLVLGVWQGVFFCEFDGPRQRKLLVQVIGV